MNGGERARPSRARLFAAFAAVYVLWGSTYVAIKFAIETLPPFTMAGLRFVGAGTLFFAWTVARGAPRATARQWRSAAIAGALMMMASNGLVCWAERRVDSSLASILVATVPLWIMMLDWARPLGRRPGSRAITGVAIGLAGVAILLWPESGGVRLDTFGVVALLVAPLCWAFGSLYIRTADLPKSMIQAAAMQMLCGGALQLLLGFALGELSGFEPANVSAKSVWSLFYLLVAGSLLGFTAYVYLLRHTTPVRASTYAYVNPLVAVILGVWLANETFTLTQLVGAAVVLVGVVLTLTAASTSRAQPATPPPPRDSPPARAGETPRA